jgi:hypothetical protein
LTGIIAVATMQAIPRPKGWIGTADQWTQGLGIAHAWVSLQVGIVNDGVGCAPR